MRRDLMQALSDLSPVRGLVPPLFVQLDADSPEIPPIPGWQQP